MSRLAIFEVSKNCMNFTIKEDKLNEIAEATFSPIEFKNKVI